MQKTISCPIAVPVAISLTKSCSAAGSTSSDSNLNGMTKAHQRTSLRYSKSSPKRAFEKRLAERFRNPPPPASSGQ